MKRGQDRRSDFRRGDQGDDAEAAAAGTCQCVNVVHAPEQCGPIDARVAGGGKRRWGERELWRCGRRVGRELAGRVCQRSLAHGAERVGFDGIGALHGRYDMAPPRGMRRENPVEAHERVARRRDECAKSGQKLRGGYDAMRLATARIF